MVNPLPPAGTLVTVKNPDEDEIGMVNRAGRYGWRAVSFTTWNWTLQYDGTQQWTHARSWRKLPAEDGWVRIGRYFMVYWARPLGIPPLPGSPDPEAFRSEKKLRRSLALGRFSEIATPVIDAVVGPRALPPATVNAGMATAIPPVDAGLFDATPAGVRLRTALVQLAQLVPVYSGRQIAGEPVDERIKSIVVDMQDLFRRMHEHGTPQQRAMAQTQYGNLLEKLNLVVAPAHLLDVMDKPHLWENAERRLALVDDALTTLDQEIVANARRVNSSIDLNFQVAIQAITALSAGNEFDALYGEVSPG